MQALTTQPELEGTNLSKVHKIGQSAGIRVATTSPLRPIARFKRCFLLHVPLRVKGHRGQGICSIPVQKGLAHGRDSDKNIMKNSFECRYSAWSPTDSGPSIAPPYDKTGGDNSGSPVTDFNGLLYAGCFTPVMEDRFELFTTDYTLTVNVSVVVFFMDAS